VPGGPPDLERYVEALSLHRRGERAELERVVRVFGVETSRDPTNRGSTERGYAAATRLGFVRALAGEAAIEAEDAIPILSRRSETEGVVFLWALERARALARRGAAREAARAFDELVQRRSTALTTPEAAHEWRACLEEGAAAHRAAGQEARARELEARLARLTAEH
jgi:hypothetical protein